MLISIWVAVLLFIVAAVIVAYETHKRFEALDLLRTRTAVCVVAQQDAARERQQRIAVQKTCNQLAVDLKAARERLEIYEARLLAQKQQLDQMSTTVSLALTEVRALHTELRKD